MRALVIGLLLLAATAACGRGAATVAVTFETSDGRVSFISEVADTVAEQARGLMGRATLAPDRGMLFRWGTVGARGFHMKNTLIPLDLVAIRAGRVVSIHTMQPCTADPCPVTTTAPADAALEINAGAAAAHGLAVGTLVRAPALR